MLTDSDGVPLVVQTTPANVNDDKQLPALIDARPAVQGPLGRPRRNPGSIVGDRAYGNAAGKVAALARAAAEGLLSGGILPVLKHIPGHGRAAVDSHESLPVVDAPETTLEKTDFAAFRPLCDLPLGMTAHVVYRAIDPIAPATTSVTVVREVIRERLGFCGLLMTDDISMGALSGSIAERSRAAIAAGCDMVLHCNGALDEMCAVAAAVLAAIAHVLNTIARVTG